MKSVSPPVDLEYLKKLTKGDAALEREYARNFVMVGEGTIAGLDGFCQENDAKSWKIAARVFSECAYRIGAGELASLCSAAEKGADDMSIRPWLLDQIKAEFERTRRFLREYGLLS